MSSDRLLSRVAIGTMILPREGGSESMPLYENRDNAANRIVVDEAVRRAITTGLKDVAGRIVQVINACATGRDRVVGVAFDGWYGVDWQPVLEALAAAARPGMLSLFFVPASELFRTPEEIGVYKSRFITEDPCFGVVNAEGSIEDLMAPASVEALRTRLDRRQQGDAGGHSAILVYGPGAAAPRLSDSYDLRFYFDFTRQPVLWQMWEGRLVPFGSAEARPGYSWKEYYYCDYYLLQRQKEYACRRMDYYVEAVEKEELKLVPRQAYDWILDRLVRYPVKEVKIFQPGPWGAYRYRDLWKVPGLECNAWNELAGPELSMIVDLGDGVSLTMPCMNLMRHAELFVGRHIAETYPGLFPLDVWLDDGYFPRPTPAERTSMPIHNHPDSDYVRRHFEEPLGRYETYYIAEAYEGATTWGGFTDDANLEDWEAKCRWSERTGQPIEDWKESIAAWPTNVGDLFLIPPGTTHAHGGNQMVLEMDTCPSVAATEYSFFMYDFRRPSWDDATKSMTGRPVRMQLDHGFATEKWRRAGWVRDHLWPKAKVVRWTRDYCIDRYDSYGPMPFHIERVHFTRRGQHDTEGAFMHIATLTVGTRVRIRSLTDPGLENEIDLFQSVIIPACFGPYEYLNEREGMCTIVLIRWKEA